jgi:hypothetical protein
VAGIGALPNTDWLAGSGIAVNGPILVALYSRADRLTGAFTLNAPNRLLMLRRALAARTPLAQVLGEFAVHADPAV